MENVYIEIIQPVLQSILRYCIYALVALFVLFLIYLGKRYLLPILKEKLGDTRFNSLMSYIRWLMCAAEEKFTAACSGKSKSEFVISLVKKKYPDLDEEYIQTAIDGLMAPLTAEGLVNVTNGADAMEFMEFAKKAINEAMNEASKREAEKQSEINPDPFAPGAAPGVDTEEPPKNPDPEALDAPPID